MTEPPSPPPPPRPAAPAPARAGAAQPSAQARPQQPATPDPRRGQVISHPASADGAAARPAAPRRRHRLVAASFLLMVAAPAAASIAYLYGVAADQYASRMAFSVRSSESSPPVEFLGALTRSVGGAAGPDAEIIHEFIRSQRMVELVLEAMPLERIYNRPTDDVVFRLGEDQPIEEIVDYWNWMTDVSYDSGSGIVNFEARAFDPDSAREISAFVLEQSTRLVNALSETARNDAVQVARDVLTEAEDRLRAVRREIRAFRDVEQELAPTENARAALGLVTALESDLARAQVELDSQLELVGERSPRIQVLRQRIASLEKQIADERARLGAGAQSPAAGRGRAFPDLLARYEELAVDREFAENAYVSALGAYEQAQVEARRQMRYLAPHIEPTTSVAAQYPERALLSLIVFLVLSVVWAVLVLVLYNIRDRR